MDWTEAIGWVASGLVLVSFLMTVMTRLRTVAVVSNVVFITYGVLAGLTSVVVLHVILLPVNLWRLAQIRRLIAELESADTGGFETDWLVKHATQQSFAAGTDIVRVGSPATELYLIVSVRSKSSAPTWSLARANCSARSACSRKATSTGTTCAA